MRTLLAFLIISSAAYAQRPTTYSVQRFGGQIILVPQGIIKTGPRSYSAFDPANPYRTQLDYSGRSGYDRAQRSAAPIVNYGPIGAGAIIIVNPFVTGG
jgi:hypothetical protein